MNAKSPKSDFHFNHDAKLPISTAFRESVAVPNVEESARNSYKFGDRQFERLGTKHQKRPRGLRLLADAIAHSNGEFIKFPLTRGLHTLVDLQDIGALGGYKWSVVDTGRGKYAVRNGGKRGCVYLHREIMKPPDGMVVDHKNGDTLDNRRENLRVCTIQQNCHNNAGRKIRPEPLPRGVYRNRKAYVAQIREGGTTRYIGSFPTPELAARAFDEAALRSRGEFARTNFPRPAAERGGAA